MFTVKIQNEECIHHVVPTGRLDTLNSALFNEEIQALLDKEEHIVVDFSLCNYLSSTGIRSLMTAAKTLKAKGGALLLACLPAEVFQVIEMAGLQPVFQLFETREGARDEIIRLRNETLKSGETQINDHHFRFQQLNTHPEPPLTWQNQEIVGYNELGTSVGLGVPAETLAGEDGYKGLFITIGNCAGFIPSDKTIPTDFRVLQNPSAGGIFVQWAVSFGLKPASLVKLVTPSEISLDQLIDAVMEISRHFDAGKPKALLLIDTNPGAPSISLIYIYNQEETIFQGARVPSELSENIVTTENGYQVLGATFRLTALPALKPGDSLLSYTKNSLTLSTIEGIKPLSRPVQFHDPVLWLLGPGEWKDAATQRIKVETTGNFAFEPYKVFLARRLYADSARVLVKQLHGGYSAQTFQVDSFDHAGRKLRPTVLKIANRALISRETDRCQRYALPYILNNSAIILGAEFYGDIGALRYNFVGIGGEQTELKWLTHYYTSWPAEELEQLFDKIFQQILKPWYGQPIRETIHPYQDHDPTLTFFPSLCETAEELFSISADNQYFTIDETSQKRMNPYWFLRHIYKSRRRAAIDYLTSVCHGDLNMQNILLDQQMNVYLIDFSETRPRSVVSDFARLEAIFMIEHAPLDSEDDLKEMIAFTTRFYDNDFLHQLPLNSWHGGYTEKMARNIAMTLKMRKYAIQCTPGFTSIVPYYMALLEWVLPVVCYGSVSLPHKKLSACIAGLLCEKVMKLDINTIDG